MTAEGNRVDSRPSKGRRRTALGRRLRRSFLFAAVSFAALSLFNHAAGDKLDTALTSMGRSMSELADDDDVHLITLNGIDIEVQSSLVETSVTDVLDEAASSCGEMRTIRKDGEQGGFVACLDGTGEGLLGLIALSQEALFGSDGEAGLVRFVYAEKKPDGTKTVSLASDQAISVTRLMPTSGDAPGFDLVGVPRPAGGKRWMSFRERGYDYQSVIYGNGEKTAAELVEEYAAELRSRGYRVHTPNDLARALRGTGRVGEVVDEKSDGSAPANFSGETFLYALRGETMLFLSFSDDCEGSCTNMVSASADILESL